MEFVFISCKVGSVDFLSSTHWIMFMFFNILFLPCLALQQILPQSNGHIL
ncbi:hypothetical protein Sjap_002950 [Stephania japonica]|uniref:Uncharacterized protein n=1 Tax=Stephania japonica TaxID=461633 RepID=A0AAP0PUL7_9MAGN